MPSEVIVILVGALLVLAASIGARYLLLRTGSSIPTIRVVVAAVAGFSLSLLLLLMIGADLLTALFYSFGTAFVVAAYLFLRNKISRQS